MVIAEINHYLRKRDFNLRERANFYAGMAVGILAPIVATRYVAFGDVSGDPVKEVYAWFASAVTAIPLSIAGGVTGGFLGLLSADILKRERNRRKIENIGELVEAN